MSIPDYETLMLPVLKAFDQGAETVKDCLPTIKRHFNVSDDEALELLPSGSTTILSSRVHWARTYLSKAELLESPKRGSHRITESGRALLATRPECVNNELLERISPAFRDWRERSKNGAKPTGEPVSVPEADKASITPDEALARAVTEKNAELKDELLALVREMDPIAFERLVLRLLDAMGYGAGDLAKKLTTKASGDGGIDGIIHEDALGLDAVYVQAKRYRAENTVSRPAIQQFVGSLSGESASKGVFVTTSRFSAEAREYLKTVPLRIVLIDGDEFAKLMMDHNVGVRIVQMYEIKAIDENVFAEI